MRKRCAAGLPLIGLGVPFLAIAVPTLFIGGSPPGFLGISVAVWCLFAAAPLTSLVLALCWILIDGRSPPSDPAGTAEKSPQG